MGLGFVPDERVNENCFGDTRTKVNPPLRSASDVQAIKEAIADGTIDVIVTDHAPHAATDKEVDYEQAAFGISGLETAVPLCLALWRDGIVTLARLVAMLTVNPARILGLDAGTLGLGATADVTVVDPGRSWTVDPARMRTKGKNTPFAGTTVHGLVTHTIVAGRLAFAAEA